MDYVADLMDVQDAVTAQKVLDALAGLIGPQRYELWLGSGVQIGFDKGNVLLGVANPFAVRWVRSNILPEISQACLAVFGETRSVDVVVAKPDTPGWMTPRSVPTNSSRLLSPLETPLSETSSETVLTEKRDDPSVCLRVSPSIPRPFSPLQTPADAATNHAASKMSSGRKFAALENFVEGLSNRLACRAADLVLHHPCQINPIYIFGPTSVGKTHLLEGLWSEIRRRRDRKPPLYLTAEQLISAFLDSIQSGSRDGIQRFRNRFKGISTLLIADIQFLARANATQVELLHALESLRQQGVQMVLTGDRPLKELKGIRSEILCRLEAGMVCGIELPEREMLLKIFQNMVAARNLPIHADVCRMVASRMGTHARQLCGALNRLHAVHLSTGLPITLEVATETLADLARTNRRDVRLSDIEKAVCDTFGLSEDALRSKSRARQISTPRMLAMWLARKYTRSALSEIGHFFGDRSHSTVLTAQKKVDAWIDAAHPIHAESADVPISEAIRKIEQLLQAG